MEITSEIFQVGGAHLTSPEDAAIYLIKFGQESALVDAGCGGAAKKLLANIKQCGVKPQLIKYLLITHCHYDHTGGAAELKRHIGLEIVAHKLDAPFPRGRRQPRHGCKLVRGKAGIFPGGQKTHRLAWGHRAWRQKNRGHPRTRALAGLGCISYRIGRAQSPFRPGRSRPSRCQLSVKPRGLSGKPQRYCSESRRMYCARAITGSTGEKWRWRPLSASL